MRGPAGEPADKGTGEHGDFTPEQLSALGGLASGAIRELNARQRAAVGG